jgi:2-oxoglutarate ferredoxin oxidoreductase subunit alpha
MTTIGGNGEGFRVVYSTASHQELFDYTIKGFNTAWKYRFPTMILGDGYQAKMRESLTMYDPEERGMDLAPAEAYLGRPGLPGVDRPPGQYRNTYNVEEELYEVVEGLARDFSAIAPEVAEFESLAADQSELVVVSHGVVSRAVKEAVNELREAGVGVGYFRPITLRPLAEKELRDVANKARRLLLVESANGQMARLIKDAAYGCSAEMIPLYRPGMGITAEEVAAKVREILA